MFSTRRATIRRPLGFYCQEFRYCNRCYF